MRWQVPSGIGEPDRPSPRLRTVALSVNDAPASGLLSLTETDSTARSGF